MINFEYYSPTKIYFGKGQENEVGSIIKLRKCRKVLLHYGKNSIFSSGLYDKITASLKKCKVNYVELGGVEPNPKIDLVRQGVELCKSEKVDFILAVGGGSVIDSAKLIGVASISEEDPWKYSLHEVNPVKTIPVGVILTISAAGSELSNSCVITNPVGKLKRGFNSDIIRPVFAIMNPELTFTVSKYQTGCGIVDILMHTIERYFTNTPDIELTNNIAEGLMKSVIKAGKIAIQNPSDYVSRSTLMLASSFSHNGLTGMGARFFFTVHKIEHELSGKYDNVPHGAGLSILFPAWARYVYKVDIAKFAKFAYNVMDVSHNICQEEAAIIGINRLEKYFESLGMPTRLSQISITDKSFLEMANKATNNGDNLVDGIKRLTIDDIVNIFKLAK